LTLGGEYSLSKNLLLYTTVGEGINRGKADFAADIGSPAPAPGQNQFAMFSGASIKF
jgi:hypothetical protein